MVPVIRALLVKLLGHEPDNIQIVANQVASKDGKDINSEGGWQIVYHDDSHFGHDKSLEIEPYAALPAGERPTLLYAGDGVSDLSAASQTDLLFAKKGRDLVTYCQREKIPYTVFDDWSSILQTTKEIWEGKTDPKTVAAVASGAIRMLNFRSIVVKRTGGETTAWRESAECSISQVLKLTPTSTYELLLCWTILHRLVSAVVEGLGCFPMHSKDVVRVRDWDRCVLSNVYPCVTATGNFSLFTEEAGSVGH
ncbi:phosphoserine phosphatase [Histoplasma capsulatum H143]|uniref:Phosphoserine phosphatase n=1 Tax=Ajellomyces capsulatus (strain H143) TaxID=544712 RepID=C6HD46_AJECH|nr:phosphoserine phosphatase [Histoplasma capsulatum H143]